MESNRKQITLTLNLVTIFTIMLLHSCKREGTKTIEETSKINNENKSSLKPASEKKQNFVFPQIHAHLNRMVSEFIFKIFEDINNNFWFCTNHDGLIKYDSKNLINYTNKDGLGGNAVRCVIQDPSGTLWFGTSGGLTKHDGNTFTNLILGPNPEDNEIWSLAIDEQNTLWIATNNGVKTFDGTTFKSFHVPLAEVATPKPMISQKRIGGIMIDSKDQKWFITDGYGITLFDNKNFKFLTKNNGLTDNNVATVYEDRKQNIWIGTFYGGISQFNGKSFINYTKDKIITGNEAYNLCEDDESNIWFSSEGYGVYKFDGKTFTQFTTENGLASNQVQHIYKDKKGQIWCCTWQGISMFDGSSFVDASIKEPWTK